MVLTTISESSKFSEKYLSHIEVRHFCVMGYYIQSVAPRGKDGGIDILMDINEDNQSLILETIDGNLIVVTDEMPTTFHGCYVTRKASIVRSSFCSAPSRNWSVSALRASIMSRVL